MLHTDDEPAEPRARRVLPSSGLPLGVSRRQSAQRRRAPVGNVRAGAEVTQPKQAQHAKAAEQMPHHDHRLQLQRDRPHAERRLKRDQR